MDETVVCERGAYNIFPIGTNFTVSHLLMVRTPLGYHYLKINETFGWWGFDGRHHPQQQQQQQQTTSMADVNPRLIPF